MFLTNIPMSFLDVKVNNDNDNNNNDNNNNDNNKAVISV